MIQRKYKDKLFTYIFGREERKEYLLSLYNALNDKEYTDVNDLTISTIEDVIYLGYKNDVSCIVTSDEVLSLYEQQSTFNPNMPVRGLFYFSKLYEKYITVNKLNVYGSSKLRLPTPQYYVFYVGKKDVPERIKLKLSDLFAEKTDVLECCATMININPGYNTGIMEKCKPLYEYSYFIDAVYRNVKIYDILEEAIDKAVDQCVNENILADILLSHKAEVKDMILTEFNEEEYIDMVKAESKAEGIEIGKTKGIEIGKTKGIEIGKTEGIEIGKKQLILEMITDGTITCETGAKKLGIPLEELEKIIDKSKQIGKKHE